MQAPQRTQTRESESANARRELRNRTLRARMRMHFRAVRSACITPQRHIAKREKKKPATFAGF
jgi:hypothetical protein